MFKKLLNISAGSAVLGLIFLFIKPVIGILLLFVYGVGFFYINKKYPNELKNFRKEQENLRNAKKAMPEKISYNFKFYDVIHVSGIEYADMNSKCEISVSSKDVSFSDKDGEFLACFNYDELKNCTIYEEIEQSLKNKAPITRTIVGGILLGPVGAVIGGVSGVVPTIKENKKYYLEFEFKDTDLKDNIIVSGNYKVLEEIKQDIKTRVQNENK